MLQSESTHYRFHPARTLGFFVLIPLFLVLLALDVGCFFLFMRQEPGLLFFLLLIASFLLIVPVVFLGYRIFSLIFSAYSLGREGLRIQWGLRTELIPLSEIEWIRTPKEMPYDIPWSFLPMPGAYSGSVRSENYPLIEFIASDTLTMLFVGTSRCIYAISPARPQEFMAAFDRVLQMGTLNKVEWQTIRPVDWVNESLKNRTARFSIRGSLLLIIILLLWVGFRYSSRTTIGLAYSANGVPQVILPVRNVLILPALAVFCWLANLATGVRLYKTEQNRQLAELFWAGSVVISFFFVLSAFLIL